MCTHISAHVSGGRKCPLVGVPWRGSVSARLAWGDVVSFKMLSKVLEMLSVLKRQQGTPMRAHLQLPQYTRQKSSIRPEAFKRCGRAFITVRGISERAPTVWLGRLRVLLWVNHSGRQLKHAHPRGMSLSSGGRSSYALSFRIWPKKPPTRSVHKPGIRKLIM